MTDATSNHVGPNGMCRAVQKNSLQTVSAQTFGRTRVVDRRQSEDRQQYINVLFKFNCV